MIEKLIEEGNNIKKYNKENEYGNWFEGQEYETWNARTLLFIEKNYKGMEVCKNFIVASKSKDMQSYDERMGILIALQDDYNEKKDSKEKLLNTINDMNSY